MRLREGLVQFRLVPVGTCVPAGPQDSSVGDAGHTGHWAQRVIEPSPVQNRIRQDRNRGHGTLLRLCGCFFVVVFPLKLHGLGLNGGAAIWLEELLMNVRPVDS